MTDPRPSSRRSRHADFWRACRFLAPYRAIVAVSVVSAFLVGAITTGGLSAMLPILQVLINEQTIPGWLDRQIVERRLGVSLAGDGARVVVSRVRPGSAAEDAAVRSGDWLPGDDAALARLAVGSAPVQFARSGEAPPTPVTPGDPPAVLPTLRRVAGWLPTHPVRAIAAVFGFIAALAVVGNVVRFVQEYLSDKAAISAVNDLRRRLYDHILHLPLAYFGRHGTSDVTSRLVQDCQGLQDGFKILLGQSIQEPIKAGFAFLLALAIDWRLTLFIVLFAPVMAVMFRKFGKKIRRATRAALQRSSAMLGQIEGTLVGVRIVKSALGERLERRRYGAIMGDLRQQQLRMARYEAVATPALETASLLVVGAVLLMASYLVLVRRTLDASSFFLVMACLVAIGESLRRVSKLNAVLQRSNAAATRVFELLDLPAERQRSLGQPARRRLAPFARQIRFESVRFTYPGADHPAVDDVDLEVRRGMSVAVVGRNGSGKTTLLSLLPRFYDADSGRVAIDGIDVRDVTLRSLRRQIGLVTQESVLFPGTIAENIAYGSRRATPAQIEEAARRAFADEFIRRKPQGYDTPLDGLGAQLSGGQRQRLNIARAILRRAPILILDEATSQVDAESEHLIQQAIQQLMHECTTFVIAHRFSTILAADRIVVMDAGRIVGQGTHDELQRSCAVYRQLYERQLVAAPTEALT